MSRYRLRRAPLRALQLLAVVPAGHFGLQVGGDEFAPHLHECELAVVDASDRDPQHGEIYAVQVAGFDGPVTMLAQAIARHCISDAEDPFVGWFRQYGFAEHGAGKIHMDGPMREQRWTERCLGRVVGYMPARYGA